MPVPIMLVNNPKPKSDNQYVMDYSFLAQMPLTKKTSSKQITASNKDASLLMDLWLNGDKTSKDMYQLNNKVKISSKDIIRLKTHGLLIGNAKEFKITNRGKAVITTMTLGESNKFLKKKKEKSYTEILANVSKQGKKGYRMPTFTSNSHLLRLNNSIIK